MPLPDLVRDFLADSPSFRRYLLMHDIIPGEPDFPSDNYLDEAFTRGEEHFTAFAATTESDGEFNYWCLWAAPEDTEPPMVVLLWADREISFIAPTFEAFLARLGIPEDLVFGADSAALSFEEMARTQGRHSEGWQTELARYVTWSARRGITPRQPDPDAMGEAEQRLDRWAENAAPW